MLDRALLDEGAEAGTKDWLTSLARLCILWHYTNGLGFVDDKGCAVEGAVVVGTILDTTQP